MSGVNQGLSREGTFSVRECTSWSRDLRVSTAGEGVVAMAGAVSLRMLADRSGLTRHLSRALARPDFSPVHDRGRVLTDVATAIGCGARDIVDVEALRVQDQLFGHVASDTTCGWALGEVGKVERARIAAARAAACEHMWHLGIEVAVVDEAGVHVADDVGGGGVPYGPEGADDVAPPGVLQGGRREVPPLSRRLSIMV
jgi:hypothetical protein